MKKIPAPFFDIIALSLPRGLAFGDNPPIDAWLSDNEISCAALTRNVNSGCFGTIILRRRTDGVWGLLNRNEFIASEDEAQVLIQHYLNNPSFPSPVPSGIRRHLPLSKLGKRTPSEVFKALASPKRRLGAWMLNQLYLALPSPDVNWVPDCQTGNFHTRLWEAHLLAIFREQGLLGFVRKVVVAKIAAMTGWRPVWQGVTNFLMHHGS